MCEECSGKKSVGTLAKESLTREAKDLANEGKKLSNDLTYLKETKIPELESKLKSSLLARLLRLIKLESLLLKRLRWMN